jgi:uncharacterized membrane protein
MTIFERIAGAGYTLALLAVVLGFAFVVTGSAEGAAIVAILEGVFWAALQYFKHRRDRRLKPLT